MVHGLETLKRLNDQASTERKLFAVSCGEYSDYKIVAIYDSKELADRHVFAAPECFRIEEYELNPTIPYPPGMQFFTVWVKSSGEVTNVFLSDDEPDDGSSHVASGGSSYVWEKLLYCDCWARDEKHAAKIASEKWAQAKAAGKFDPPPPDLYTPRTKLQGSLPEEGPNCE